MALVPPARSAPSRSIFFAGSKTTSNVASSTSNKLALRFRNIEEEEGITEKIEIRGVEKHEEVGQAKKKLVLYGPRFDMGLEDPVALVGDGCVTMIYSQTYHLAIWLTALSRQYEVSALSALGSNNVLPSYSSTQGTPFSPCFNNPGISVAVLLGVWITTGLFAQSYKTNKTVDTTLSNACLNSGLHFVQSLPFFLLAEKISQDTCGCALTMHGVMSTDLSFVAGLLGVITYWRMGWNYVSNIFRA